MAGLTEQEVYSKLAPLVMPEPMLRRYGYPYRDPDNPELCMAIKDGRRMILHEHFRPSYTCYRCKKVYRVGQDGISLPSEGTCVYHPQRTWNQGSWNEYYLCCNRSPRAIGCSSNAHHVHRDEPELENYRGFVETEPRPELDPDRHGIYALDCEMCYTTHGLELTRVSVINYNEVVVYEKLVKPTHAILDLNTKTSGIAVGDLDGVNTSLADVQRDLLAMFSNKTILVGHGIENDMKVLKMFHTHFIDTAQLYPHKRGLPFKRALRHLATDFLGYSIQNGAGHDSHEDAVAALRLVMMKARINRG